MSTWRERALCAGMAPMFDDELDGESAGWRKNRIALAQRVCAQCPVSADCRREAKKQVNEGVWDGEPLAPVFPKEVPEGSGVRRLTEIKHGTTAGYVLHLRRKVPICERCRIAESDRLAKRRSQRSESAA
jgi:hypothetical protein